ncbi:hypothetical protein BDZ45DRAFT_735979 [Acephala macrosclerotiorum]|nr:hypothetical protein BDZ45DRAFT_735979 [Acephala macrosclerotiorum]
MATSTTILVIDSDSESEDDYRTLSTQIIDLKLFETPPPESPSPAEILTKIQQARGEAREQIWSLTMKFAAAASADVEAVTFTTFNDLTPELRRNIWKQALESSLLVEIKWSGRARRINDSSQSGALSVNGCQLRGSFDKLTKLCSQLDRPVWGSNKEDATTFPPRNDGLHQIERLVIGWPMLESLLGGNPNHSEGVIEASSQGVLTVKLSYLKQLILVSQERLIDGTGRYYKDERTLTQGELLDTSLAEQEHFPDAVEEWVLDHEKVTEVELKVLTKFLRTGLKDGRLRPRPFGIISLLLGSPDKPDSDSDELFILADFDADLDLDEMVSHSSDSE